MLPVWRPERKQQFVIIAGVADAGCRHGGRVAMNSRGTKNVSASAVHCLHLATSQPGQPGSAKLYFAAGQAAIVHNDNIDAVVLQGRGNLLRQVFSPGRPCLKPDCNTWKCAGAARHLPASHLGTIFGPLKRHERTYESKTNNFCVVSLPLSFTWAQLHLAACLKLKQICVPSEPQAQAGMEKGTCTSSFQMGLLFLGKRFA